MTTTPEHRTDIEGDLATRLSGVARGFVADLEAQGRLVGPGEAEVLERLRTQIEARRDLPAAFQDAVDTIADECGFPRDVAVRAATALRRKGLLRDDGEPEPEHAPTPGPGPLTPVSGIVMPRVRPRPAPAPAVHVEQVAGQVPHVRPAAAQPPAVDADRAAAWNRAQAQAVTIATRLRNEHADRLEVSQIAPNHERVTVAIRAASLDDWEYWLRAIGAPHDVVTWTAGYAQLAKGRLDGVEIHLTAHGVPRLLHEAEQAALEPFYLWGRMYDLSRTHVDKHGRQWVFLGQRQAQGGMPVMTQRGHETRAALASIVKTEGHLVAEPTAAAAPSKSAGGQQ
ncbi:BN159_2729 family protein [Streptomyces griseorubiginosus]|uniref:BN159_2729 family protein n=1 Tax=Streptomyces griseorubiginosus TaxID=67304 RepID=UPI003625B5AD